MARKSDYDVLVVGAGPVGMMVALCLSTKGLQVKIIDEEWCPAARSYACALHPRTLQLFDRLGLLDKILAAGRKVSSIGFYDSEAQHAQLRLSELSLEHPYLLVVGQHHLESVLEHALKDRANVHVDWNCRLSRLQPNGSGVIAHLDKLGETGKGYSVPSLEWGIKKSLHTSAGFVVGADGHNSIVRQSLIIDYTRFGEPEQFNVYEFEADHQLSDEVRVVFYNGTTNVCWPLPNEKCRWSFQTRDPQGTPEPRFKDRVDLWVIGSQFDDGARFELEHLIEQRAHWFDADIRRITWSIEVQFEHRLAKHFGSNHCWLAGDAAHQTGPVGVQSLNVGLLEAEELAEILARVIQEGASLNLLYQYDRNHLDEWQSLLGVTSKLVSTKRTEPWIRMHASRILPCIPASGPELHDLAHQIELELR